jgi:hypothetical protein
VGYEATARGEEMYIPIGNALALMSWHDFKLFLADFTEDGAVWLLIGFFLAIVVLARVAMEVALVLHTAHRPQSRAKWSAEDSKSTIAESPAEGMLE